MILPNIGTGCVDIWEGFLLLLGNIAGTDVIVSVPLRNSLCFELML